MSRDVLSQLDGVRRDAVERARIELISRRQAHEQARHAHEVALRAQSDGEAKLRSAYADFARATTVVALRSAEVHAGGVRQGLATLVARCERTAKRCQLSELALRRAEDAVRAAEVARRVVGRTLDQRAADVSLRTERASEEAAEDAHRARPRD